MEPYTQNEEEKAEISCAHKEEGEPVEFDTHMAY